MDPTGRLELSHLLQRCTFDPPGTPVRCGVSGGADSLALLVLAVHAGLEVTAVHVDHGIRPDSSAETDLVATSAERFGASFEAHTVVVEPGPNLEERARDARRSVLGAGALTGHTADDQAETVLLQLMFGAGPKGIAAMVPGPAKPLLDLRRADTEAVCTAAGISWFSDPSNVDPRFRRNRVRAELIPLMNDIADRDVVPLLVRSAAKVGAAQAVLDQLLPDGDPADTRWLQTLPDSVATLVVRRWLSEQIGRPLSAAATTRVMEVVAHTRKATELSGGRRLHRSDGLLRLD